MEVTYYDEEGKLFRKEEMSQEDIKALVEEKKLSSKDQLDEIETYKSYIIVEEEEVEEETESEEPAEEGETTDNPNLF